MADLPIDIMKEATVFERERMLTEVTSTLTAAG